MDFESKDLPEAFDSLKVVFVSDIHHGPFFSRDRLARICEQINQMKPDLILLGGDYVHRSPRYIEPSIQELVKLRAKYGVFAVLGNHDYWEGYEESKRAFSKTDITLLTNASRWIYAGSQRIKILGVDDLFEGSPEIASSLWDVKEEDFLILVSHNPDYAEKIKDEKRIDLMLSDHTHGGQVSFFGLYAPILPSAYGQKYRSGLVELDHFKVLVSNGLGTITPPIRFFARPQINVITLKRPSS